MSLEKDIQLFCTSYRPILRVVRDKSTPLSEEELVQMSKRVYVPEGWRTVSVKKFQDQYDKASKLRGEDGDGMPVEIAVARQLRRKDERVGWMEEISRQHGLIIIGECPYQFDHVVRYASIPIGEREIRFIPRYDGKKGIFIFDQPITREWPDKGFLTNSFIDSSDHGKLFGDFEDMDGAYASAQFLERMEAARNDPFGKKVETAVKLKLVYVPKSKPGVGMISFDLDRLGEGEVDSFLKHVSYVT